MGTGFMSNNRGNPEGHSRRGAAWRPGRRLQPGDAALFRSSGLSHRAFDQRGCGRSKPHASVEANTTWHLVADIEHIRQRFGIETWTVFGGSWGATLALIYAQAHPDRVNQLVLRGVFMMTQAELEWFYGGAAGQFWPETWDRFQELIPEDERGDMIAAYHRRLFSGDRATETTYAKAWAAWENAVGDRAFHRHQRRQPGGLRARVFTTREPLFHPWRVSRL